MNWVTRARVSPSRRAMFAWSAPSDSRCWYNSVTYAVSIDGGRTFTKPNAPSHVLAPAPNAWVPPPVYPSSYVAEGYFQPSSIVRGPDGYYYSLMLSIRDKSSGQGISAIRGNRLDDPTSWRAWDGSGFNLRLTSPYATGASATVCTYLYYTRFNDGGMPNVLDRLVFGDPAGPDANGMRTAVSAEGGLKNGSA